MSVLAWLVVLALASGLCGMLLMARRAGDERRRLEEEIGDE